MEMAKKEAIKKLGITLASLMDGMIEPMIDEFVQSWNRYKESK